MTDRRILARLPLPRIGRRELEFVLLETSREQGNFVRFETSFRDVRGGPAIEMSNRFATNCYYGDVRLRTHLHRSATGDFAARYYRIIIGVLFKGDQEAALGWMRSELNRDLRDVLS